MRVLLLAALSPGRIGPSLRGKRPRRSLRVPAFRVHEHRRLPKPMAAIGRVVFESGGHINGYFVRKLRRPLARQSGHRQLHLPDRLLAHLRITGRFRRVAALPRHRPAGRRARPHSPDRPGTGVRGIFQKLPDACSAASFRGRFNVTSARKDRQARWRSRQFLVDRRRRHQQRNVYGGFRLLRAVEFRSPAPRRPRQWRQNRPRRSDRSG